MRRNASIFWSAVAAMFVGTPLLPAAQAPPSGAPERDPFTPPTAAGSRRSVVRRVQPVERRLSDLRLDGVVLIGVACSRARQAAVLRSRSGRAWAIAPGDRLRDSRVARVTCDAVLFEIAGAVGTRRHAWRHLGGRPAAPKPGEGGKETR
ncbi:MAG: hypothetical protein ACRD2X_23220 [Vicinamibacteraceae bacterium]